MPTGNPELTNQRAFYVAIGRARDAAELVTDDAWKPNSSVWTIRNTIAYWKRFSNCFR